MLREEIKKLIEEYERDIDSLDRDSLISILDDLIFELKKDTFCIQHLTI